MSQRSGGDTNSGTGGSGKNGSPILTEALIDAIEENLVRNDLLQANNNDARASSCHENEQTISEPLMICPKQPNLPQATGASPKFKSLFGRFRQKNKAEKPSAVSNMSRFSLPFFNRNLADKSQATGGSGSSEENMDNLVEIRPGSGHYRTRSSEGELMRQQKSNLNRRPSQQQSMPTEVRMINGMPVVQPTTSADTTGDSARRPNSLFLNGHNYPRQPGPVSGQHTETSAPAPAQPMGQPPGQPIFNEMPPFPVGQPIFNEMPPVPVGQPVYNEMPSVVQPIYNEMPANPGTYNPVNLSVNVVPGAGISEAINEAGGAFSLGSDAGPPPNVDLPANWNYNLGRAGPPPPTVALPTLAPQPPSGNHDEGEQQENAC